MEVKLYKAGVWVFNTNAPVQYIKSLYKKQRDIFHCEYSPLFHMMIINAFFEMHNYVFDPVQHNGKNISLKQVTEGDYNAAEQIH